MVLPPAPPELWGVGLWNACEAKLAPIVPCLIWLLEVLTFFCNLALPAALTPSPNINVLYIFNMPFPSPPFHIVGATPSFSVHLHVAAGTGLCLSPHRGRIQTKLQSPVAWVLCFQGALLSSTVSPEARSCIQEVSAGQQQDCSGAVCNDEVFLPVHCSLRWKFFPHHLAMGQW